MGKERKREKKKASSSIARTLNFKIIFVLFDREFCRGLRVICKVAEDEKSHWIAVCLQVETGLEMMVKGFMKGKEKNSKKLRWKRNQTETPIRNSFITETNVDKDLYSLMLLFFNENFLFHFAQLCVQSWKPVILNWRFSWYSCYNVGREWAPSLS